MQREPLLKACRIGKDYPRSKTSALKELSLEVGKGEFLAVMGSSGSGKSTLLYLLSGLDRPSAGSIQFKGREITDRSEKELALLRRDSMGFVFQDFNLIPHYSLLQNIVVPGRLGGKAYAEVAARALGLLRAFGIADLAARMPSQVSGGEAQRCSVARAMINEPEIIFADEPTGNLNSASSSAILDMLGSIHAEGRTILLVTHELKAASRAERVVFIQDGAVRDSYRFAAGETGEVRERVLFDWLSSKGW